MTDIYCECGHTVEAGEQIEYAGKQFCDYDCRNAWVYKQATYDDYHYFAMVEDRDGFNKYLADNSEILADVAVSRLPSCEMWDTVYKDYCTYDGSLGFIDWFELEGGRHVRSEHKKERISA